MAPRMSQPVGHRARAPALCCPRGELFGDTGPELSVSSPPDLTWGELAFLSLL